MAIGSGTVIAAVLGGERDLLRAGILLLIVPLISLAVALRGRVRLNAWRSVEPSRIAATEPATVHLQISKRARLPTGVLLIEDSIPFTLGARPRFVLDHVWSRVGRDLTYTVRPMVRGRYPVGPLTMRVTDPFGLVELRRPFSDIATLVATPTVLPLPNARLTGEWSGSGDSRPRAVATAGEEDATVRAYRTGDDMRRVHWRATAHHGDLMVRREEQPWQSRATVLLDTRSAGHTGEGIDSSLEWGVTAAASIGVHLSERGYAVKLASDDPGGASAAYGDRAIGRGHNQAAMLDALAVVTAQRDASVGRWPDLLERMESSTGLLVAVLGRLDEQEAHLVAGLRESSTSALAILLDTMSWTSMPHQEREHTRLASTEKVLTRAGWSVVTARRGDQLAPLWERLGLHSPSTYEVRSTPGVA